ncbi:unnamed protein product, partial [Thlaspi arvense]
QYWAEKISKGELARFILCLSLGSLFLTRPISGLTCTVKLASSCEVSNLNTQHPNPIDIEGDSFSPVMDRK